MKLHRPTLGPLPIIFVVSLLIVFADNVTFWHKASDYMAKTPMALYGMAVGFMALHMAVFSFASTRFILKPLLLFFIICGGVAAWFVDSFGIIIDQDMIRNAAETTVAETNNLMTGKYLLHLLIYVIIPCALLLWIKIDYRPALKQAKWNLLYTFVFFTIFAAFGLANSAAYYSTFRMKRDLVGYFNPIKPLDSLVKFAFKSNSEKNIVAQPIGEDAKIATTNPDGKPRVLVMVIGETARAMNFSLNGYNKQTNPELEKQPDIINFPNVSSCGTNTAYSLPCMFSIETKSSFTHRKAREKYNAADILKQAGANVEWWDNNTGDKHIADRITLKEYMNDKDPEFCFEGECQDGILVKHLDGWLDNVKGDSVLFMHTLGSHGPTYYKRYPKEFRKFTPDCQTAELGDCTNEEIVNAYDNTLVYTDHIVSQVIDKLKAREGDMDVSVLYLSDHGESLGENGIYLHSAPIMFAPKEQTSVPMVMWVSKGFADSGNIDQDCLRQKAGETYSHDNLFHTLLGLMDVNTKVKQTDLDIVASCKGAKTS